MPFYTPTTMLCVLMGWWGYSRPISLSAQSACMHLITHINNHIQKKPEPPIILKLNLDCGFVEAAGSCFGWYLQRFGKKSRSNCENLLWCGRPPQWMPNPVNSIYCQTIRKVFTNCITVFVHNRLFLLSGAYLAFILLVSCENILLAYVRTFSWNFSLVMID